jgi:predicted DNA-binding protein (MmcQ/YjbR family)
MSVSGARAEITRKVLQWGGVQALPHRFGGTQYNLGKRELGHIHGDHLVDIPFPTRVRNELVAAGRAEPHHLLSESGWVSVYLRKAEDVERAIELLELSFNLASKQKRRKAPGNPLGDA